MTIKYKSVVRIIYSVARLIRTPFEIFLDLSSTVLSIYVSSQKLANGIFIIAPYTKCCGHLIKCHSHSATYHNKFLLHSILNIMVHLVYFFFESVQCAMQYWSTFYRSIILYNTMVDILTHKLYDKLILH